MEADIVLLDYNTNADYTNLKSPLSHAALIKLFIEDRYPEPGSANEIATSINSVQLSLFDELK